MLVIKKANSISRSDISRKPLIESIPRHDFLGVPNRTRECLRSGLDHTVLSILPEFFRGPNSERISKMDIPLIATLNHVRVSNRGIFRLLLQRSEACELQILLVLRGRGLYIKDRLIFFRALLKFQSIDVDFMQTRSHQFRECSPYLCRHSIVSFELELS